jgi:hemolysin III
MRTTDRSQHAHERGAPRTRRDYRRAELLADGTVHIIGIFLGVAGAIWLALSIPSLASAGKGLAVAIYALALVTMLSASAAYNMCRRPPLKWWLRRIDHSAIYIMIAGTYSPFLAEMPNGWPQRILLTVVWSVALIGLVLKLTMPGRLERLSILLYLALGWSGLAASDSLSHALDERTWWLLGAGGLIYSVGVIFHLCEGLPFHNVIWHCFVLAAAICHYVAVLGVL